VADAMFRLRINYQKLGALCYLSHLEMCRALERLVRRARLPFAISQGFNVHMRFSPGPALPVGTQGLDEYYDVLLTEYVKEEEAFARLKAVTVEELPVLGVCYVDPKAKGLAATHVYESYELILQPFGLLPEEIEMRLHAVIAQGVVKVRRKNKEKVYDLGLALENPQTVEVEGKGGLVVVRMTLRSTEQGSLRPESIIMAGWDEELSSGGKDVLVPRIVGNTRTRLAEEMR